MPGQTLAAGGGALAGGPGHDRSPLPWRRANGAPAPAQRRAGRARACENSGWCCERGARQDLVERRAIQLWRCRLRTGKVRDVAPRKTDSRPVSCRTLSSTTPSTPFPAHARPSASRRTDDASGASHDGRAAAREASPSQRYIVSSCPGSRAAMVGIAVYCGGLSAAHRRQRAHIRRRASHEGAHPCCIEPSSLSAANTEETRAGSGLKMRHKTAVCDALMACAKDNLP